MTYRSAVAGWIVVVLCACSTTPPRDADPESLAELRSGDRLFGEAVTIEEAAEANVLAIDEDMDSFVRQAIAGATRTGARFQLLIDAMIDDGLLTLDYDPNLTLTARQTFHQRKGNCLSFTNLFVALARRADLEVAFQMVEIPPIWHGEDDFVMLNNHINVVVRDVALQGAFKRDYVVDFNTAEYDGNYVTQRVTDGYARGLYYSNVAVEKMRRGDDRGAFAYLLRALDSADRVGSVWVNLGVLYSRSGHFDLAEAAYLKALDVDRNSKSAMVNLVRLYERRGDEQDAEYYRRRIRGYQRSNPYYHYWQAGSAYREGRYQESQDALDRAILLKQDEHQFYYLKSLVYYRTGNRDAARRYMSKAREYASRDRLEQAYNEKLEALKLR